MARRYVVVKAEGVAGPPIQADEPCFVIRANDVLAQRMLNHYIDAWVELDGDVEPILSELIAHQQAVGDWQRSHGVKVADR